MGPEVMAIATCGTKRSRAFEPLVEGINYLYYHSCNSMRDSGPNMCLELSVMELPMCGCEESFRQDLLIGQLFCPRHPKLSSRYNVPTSTRVGS